MLNKDNYIIGHDPAYDISHTSVFVNMGRTMVLIHQGNYTMDKEKEYKLKKKYPSLPEWVEVGDVAIPINSTYTKYSYIISKESDEVLLEHRLTEDEVERDPLYWEELELKDYKILSYIYEDTIFNEKGSNSMTNNAWYSEEGTWIDPDQGDNSARIHSIMRMQDKEIFTLGDKAKSPGAGFYFQVNRILLSGGHAHLSDNISNHIVLDLAIKQKEEEKPRYDILKVKGKYSKEIKDFKKNDPGQTLHFHSIHTVKRLSDGEVFTVGDRVENNFLDRFTIKSFELDEAYQGGIKVETKNPDDSSHRASSISVISHVKTVLFTTEDGVDIYEGDVYWVPQKPYMVHNPIRFEADKTKNYKKGDAKRFSTKEKAQEWTENYRKEHKKIYSKSDIREAAKRACPCKSGLIFWGNIGTLMQELEEPGSMQ